MKKIIGWVFIILGIMIISWAIWNSYLIFTVQKPVPEIFKVEAKKDFIPQPSEKETKVFSPEEMQEKMIQEMRETISERLREMVPFEVMIKLFNLISWSIFAGILIFAGGKISEIGIKLL